MTQPTGPAWVSVDVRTGTPLAEFPLLIVPQALPKTISKYDTATVQFSAVGDPAPPADWLHATKPYSSMLVAVDRASDTPMWGGRVVQRQRVSKQLVSLTLETPEAYLRRRFIRDTLQYAAATWGRCEIAQDLLIRYVVDGVRPGLPLRVVRIDDGMGVDQAYKDADDKAIYSAFSDLGMEWTIALERQHNPERITLVAYIGERIGTPVDPGANPQVVFDYPGKLLTASIVEDYSDGKGANDVMATSTGSGSVRPQSAHQLASDFDERPTVEARVQTGQATTSLATLNAYALATVQQLAAGATAYTGSAALQLAPVFGKEWMLGDDVGIDLSGPEFPEHPNAIVRAIGVQLSNTTVSPVFAGSDVD